MAPKRASPMDEPASASSSSSEKEAETSSEADSSSEDDDQPPERTQPLSTEKKPAAKRPPPAAPIAKSQPKASVSESDAGSDSDDENTDLAASKPKEEKPKAKKSKSQPPVSPVPDSKRGEDAAAGKKAGDESKKLFQRLWSEDDEIAILTGLAEYEAKTGEAPVKDINGFHDFIKESIHVDASNEQLASKIRTLKRRYVKNAGRGKNGEGPNFSKPYDKRVFELSRKIWGIDEGGNVGIDITKLNGKVKKNSKEARKVEMIRLNLNRSVGLSLLGLDDDDDVIKRGYELIGASKKAELEERWKKQQIAELELFVKRAELLKDEASLIWEASRQLPYCHC